MRKIAASKVYILNDKNTTAPHPSHKDVEQRVIANQNNQTKGMNDQASQSSQAEQSGSASHQVTALAQAETPASIEQYTNHVVVIDHGHVTCHFPLTEEIAMTEWLGGTIVVRHGQATHYPAVLSPSELSADDGRGNGHIQ